MICNSRDIVSTSFADLRFSVSEFKAIEPTLQENPQRVSYLIATIANKG